MFESLIKWCRDFFSTQDTANATSTPSNQPPQPNNARANYHTLGEFNLGLGAIGPENRTDVDQSVVNAMYQTIASGKFNIPVGDSVPSICVDGRCNKDGKREVSPSAAGGTLSIVYGADLGGASTSSDTNEITLATRISNTLKEKGHAIGVHGDDHSNCGCGACAKVKNIYQHIAEKINDIVSLTSQYGITLSQSEKDRIVQQAQNRLNQSNFFAEDRSSVLKNSQECGSVYEELVGAHNELGIALNTKPGTTVDRSAIRAQYGPQYDMFVVDAWTFANAAKAINSNEDAMATELIAKAITLQNVATASVLGHGSLRIIPIS
ncbi:hypothetical protein W03_19050 [Nitrosomonas sp. PY1]|uniref:cadmium-containing carbonic anhydrase n=1 Tax=Nitrosomonas sp. PY1 TaxID=1803906 RepID=UPI001FC8019E|nr:cadmium-containing carbonic anhydrase [Nitrosomonas sp. PY1]GKS69901.1 hypothetical protein W03_19050 [Nitrosomonas sp. PY1]